MARHVRARELHLGKESGGSGGRDLLDATTAVKDGLNALPGFKTSAAFFTFLRANLVLPPTSTTYSAMSSNSSTPLLTPSNSQTLPPPSPSPLSTTSSPSLAPNSDPAPPDLASIPPLTTYTLTTREERRAGLKLVADSVAQQRQLASSAIIFHPIFLTAWVLFFALIYQFLYHVPGDIGIVVTTGGGMTMAFLVGVRMLTGPYLSFAEGMTWDYLTNPETGDEDIVIGTKFGDEIIAALVLRLEGASTATASGSKKKNKATKTGRSGKGVIRAWTTRIRYRHKGVGTGLLEEAIRITRERLGRDVEVGFAVDHANARTVLPGIFNGDFRRREQLAIRLLEEVVADEVPAGKKK